MSCDNGDVLWFVSHEAHEMESWCLKRACQVECAHVNFCRNSLRSRAASSEHLSQLVNFDAWQILQALERVRQGADIMPKEQLLKVIEQELGPDWRSRVRSFDEEPIAAASIGQVRCHLLSLELQNWVSTTLNRNAREVWELRQPFWEPNTNWCFGDVEPSMMRANLVLHH